MSYYAQVELQHFSAEPLIIAPLLTRIGQRLDDDGISRDVLKDVDQIFQTGKGLVKVHAGYIYSLIEHIHELAPDAEFGVRCMGEDLRDIWVVEFRRGEEPFRMEPQEPVAQAASEPPMFTRVSGRLLRPVYLKALLVIFLVFVILITFRSQRSPDAIRGFSRLRAQSRISSGLRFGMVLYRRSQIANAPYFLTLTLRDRRSSLLVDHVAALREAFRETQGQRPFNTIAIVVMPEHLHWLCALPEDDADFSTRVRLIKRGFTLRLLAAGVALQRDGRGEYRLWQRRFWEHTIRDDDDLQRHVDYIHYNPVKHGKVGATRDWPHSSFHRFVRQGLLEEDWGGSAIPEPGGGLGEPAERSLS